MGYTGVPEATSEDPRTPSVENSFPNRGARRSARSIISLHSNSAEQHHGQFVASVFARLCKRAGAELKNAQIQMATNWRKYWELAGKPDCRNRDSCE